MLRSLQPAKNSLVFFKETESNENLPVSVAEAKVHARIDADYTDEDTYISTLIKSAWRLLEKEANISILERTVRAEFKDYGLSIKLPYGPVSSISNVYSVENEEVDEISNTSYGLVSDRLELTTLPCGSILRVDYVTGNADAASVPAAVKIAIMQCVAHWYEHRGDQGTIPTSALFTISGYSKNTANWFI